MDAERDVDSCIEEQRDNGFYIEPVIMLMTSNAPEAMGTGLAGR